MQTDLRLLQGKVSDSLITIDDIFSVKTGVLGFRVHSQIFSSISFCRSRSEKVVFRCGQACYSKMSIYIV